jgi:hypothetical protein
MPKTTLLHDVLAALPDIHDLSRVNVVNNAS